MIDWNRLGFELTEAQARIQADMPDGIKFKHLAIGRAYSKHLGIKFTAALGFENSAYTIGIVFPLPVTAEDILISESFNQLPLHLLAGKLDAVLAAITKEFCDEKAT